MIITLQTLKPYVENAISELKKVSKVLELYCDFKDKALTFSLVLSMELSEEELEEARIAQTEVLAAFPDHEIETFIIDQYLVSGDVVSLQREISGELFYKSEEMTKQEMLLEIKGYKLVESEKSEFEKQ